MAEPRTEHAGHNAPTTVFETRDRNSPSPPFLSPPPPPPLPPPPPKQKQKGSTSLRPRCSAAARATTRQRPSEAPLRCFGSFKHESSIDGPSLGLTLSRASRASGSKAFEICIGSGFRFVIAWRPLPFGLSSGSSCRITVLGRDSGLRLVSRFCNLKGLGSGTPA